MAELLADKDGEGLVKEVLRIRKELGKTSVAASHASTRASMAEKSATMKRHPSPGMKAVLISCESRSGTSPYTALTASGCPDAREDLRGIRQRDVRRPNREDKEGELPREVLHLHQPSGEAPCPAGPVEL
mgnify:CR=1 FL=1